MADLTTREKEVVRLVCDGHCTKQVAARMNIAYHTVKAHRSNIAKKLGVSGTALLVRHAIKYGWVAP